jgi:hypothetical protein
MRRAALIPLALCLAAACGSEPTKESSPATASANPATTPTKGTSTTPAFGRTSLASKAVGTMATKRVAGGPSTVCTKFTGQLKLVQTRRAQAPNDAVLKRREASLGALVADACN